MDLSRIRVPAGNLSDIVVSQLTGRAIDEDDYICPASTPISDWWLDEVLTFLGEERELFIPLYVDWAADLVPTYQALLFETSATPQYYGYNGEFTKAINKAERDLKRFWDIPSADIQVVAMHGTVLTDTAKVAATYREVFGLSAAEAAEGAAIVREAVLASELLDGGNHALFTFNAFAFSAPGSGIPDKIVMGDAILEGFKVLGFGDVAPQAIFAHEFAHHIQYENDYFEDAVPGATTQAELTRYTELMADAYAAYYLTHKRGGTLNQKRVEQFLQVFYQIGDCAFDDGGHHGTPNQRLAAARFGFALADQAQKQGQILTSEQFHDLFVAAYPGLVAPDAP
jgi:hypothetical protein